VLDRIRLRSKNMRKRRFGWAGYHGVAFVACAAAKSQNQARIEILKKKPLRYVKIQGRKTIGYIL